MSKDAPTLLVIEDDGPIRKYLRAALEAEGYRVTLTESGDAGLRLAVQSPPDVVVLDLGLPDTDGIQVLARLREWFQAPILILSARDQETQKVAALDAGADDYLTKPFSTGELLARLRVALRHAAKSVMTASCIGNKDLTIDLANRRVLVREQEVHLTPIEYRLLATLAKHAGKVLTHRFLLKEVWGPHAVEDSHYLRVFMAALRRKIEDEPARPKYLRTEQGVGYRLIL